MGADISKTFSDDFFKKKGGILGFGGNSKEAFHNMKIVLRGLGGVGKTSLFEVFQGRCCPSDHKPSQQISTTNVLWTNPLTKERVTIEIWDVVDKAGIETMDQVAIEKIAEMSKKKGGVASGHIVFEGMDASSVDVYQDCHACIFIIDPRNLDSVEYFKDNIDAVPTHIPVLVIANFRDVRDDWKISTEELQTVINSHIMNGNSDIEENLQETKEREMMIDDIINEDNQFKTIMGQVYSGKRRVIKLIETSFLEKFGLHSLYLFLAEPFYFLQLIQLRAQIILTLANLKQANEDFDDYVKNSTYEVFLQLRKEYEEKLREEERLRMLEQQKQEQQQKEQSGDIKETKRKVFGKNSKKGNRIKSGETKKYDTITVTSALDASDSENEIEDVKRQSSLPVQNVDDFYNDKKSESNICQTIRHIEIEQLIKEDYLESPHLEPCSSSNSIVHLRERKDSMEIKNDILLDDKNDIDVLFDKRKGSIDLSVSLSSRSLLSDDESDTNSIVIKKHRETDELSDDVDDVDDVDEVKNKDDATPVLSADFCEDDTVRFGSVVSPVTSDETVKTKNVSVSTRLKNVWNRKSSEDTKPELEKKTKGEEKVSKFSKLLPMGKSKKEPVVEGVEKEGNDTSVTKPDNPSAPASIPDENKEGAKKKWEIDQRVITPVKRMLNSLKPGTSKNHSQNKEKPTPSSIVEDTVKKENTKPAEETTNPVGSISESHQD